MKRFLQTLVTLIGILMLLMMVVLVLPVDKTSGKATAIDGDSLRLEGAEIRLWGIDAPEYRQTCTKSQNGRQSEWNCGKQARTQLMKLLSTEPNLSCTKIDTDIYDRTIASCETGDGKDIGAAMIEAGYAFSMNLWPSEYARMEKTARKKKIGIWVGDVEEPKAFRERTKN